MENEKYYPVSQQAVTVDDRFWTPRQETNRKKTIPAVHGWLGKTGRIDAWDWKPGKESKPHIFWDSDIAKWIESASYSISKVPDRRLEERIDRIVDIMSARQCPDGYLNSYFINVEPDRKFTNLRDMHELYCAGHLIESAVAYFQATGKRKFLDMVSKYADHISRVFGHGKGKKPGYCGHPEIELALIRLYEATGEKRYLDLSKYFISERGRRPFYFTKEYLPPNTLTMTAGETDYSYCQSHKPVGEQMEAVGHAVRACYLYSGMAALCFHAPDSDLFSACKSIFKDIVRKKMYITGGIGAFPEKEAFSYEYDLPNENAFAETCANISLFFFAHRMSLLDCSSMYAEVMERVLYNGILPGVSLDGMSFFYSNPLSAFPHPGDVRHEHMGTQRKKWFGCSCCPPNVSRLLASLGSYVYQRNNDGIKVNLYVSGRAQIEVSGTMVAISQESNYPWHGIISFKVDPSESKYFKLLLRIPEWSRRYSVKVNRKNCPHVVEKGYAVIRREWNSGDRVEIEFEIKPFIVEANPQVRQDCGKVAVQMGPIVYCAEECDNGRNLADVSINASRPQFKVMRNSGPAGASVIFANASRRTGSGWNGRLYRRYLPAFKKIRLKLVPCFLWGNRKMGAMTVWMNKG
ncbi:MAG TPA: hypothetical protein DET40_24300 [Lentisphaeria bacterium]|nr:MAG: hypothetical protein A2X45_00060 [Lentisphaerae bacterium GWF2_50_93]HCE46681.1 hypothetical protein [Lentisphaeria bacterium]